MVVFVYINDIVHKNLMHPFSTAFKPRSWGETAGLIESFNYMNQSILVSSVCVRARARENVHVSKCVHACMGVLVYELVKLDTRSCATVSG